MATSSLTKKLRMQPGQRVLVLNPLAGYVDSLDLPDGVEVADEPGGTFDFVQLFVKDSDELEALGPAATRSVEYDVFLWISYPKKSSKVKTDLSRDVLWELMMPTGLRPVTQVSVDSTWSAMRFRPVEKVGK